MHLQRLPKSAVCKGNRMEQNSYIMEIMKQYQKKYTIVDEIFRLTGEIADSLSRNDHVSSQLLLNMRQEEMDQADHCDSKIAMFEDAMSPGERQHLRTILKDENGGVLANTWEEKKVLEIYNNIKSILQKTIEIDRRINLRLAGEDSFYKKTSGRT